jgi:hypothetical protein
VAETQLPAVARVYVAPGVFVDRVDKVVVIGGFMELHGAEATPTRALAVQESINRVWTRSFPDGHSVTCNIKVRFREEKNPPGNVVQIEAKRTVDSSKTSAGRDRTIILNANEADAFTWTPAHEFGHVIGLRDRYSEGIMSELRTWWGGTRIVTLSPGYQGNLMAVTGGVLGSNNVADIASENAPGWLGDDDQVRAWIKGHSLFEVRQLSTANKLAAIRMLLESWISTDDVLALRRVCGCAASSAEADAIRSAVDASKITDLGQRMQVRVILSNMPY